MPTTDSFADRVRVIGGKQGPVPGLVFKIVSPRLKQHCQDRAAYHKRRGEEKAAEIPQMEAAIAAMRESIDKVKNYQRDPAVPKFVSGKSGGAYAFDGDAQVSQLEQQIDQLRNDIKDHGNKAASFTFLAEAFFEGEYALEWGDLQRLEIVK